MFGFLKTLFSSRTTSEISVSAQASNVSSGSDSPIPIEQRIRGLEPSCGSLYPHEVLALHYAVKYSTSDTEFALFWWNRYGIKNPQEIFQSLCRRGFLAIKPLKDSIAKQTIPVIQAVLREQGLKVSGKKADLVERLLQSVPEQILLSKFPQKYYMITESGERALNENPIVLYIHRKPIYDLDIFTAADLIKNNPGKDFLSILIEEGLSHAEKMYREQKFGLYRNDYVNISELYQQKGEEEKSFDAICETVRVDLSGSSFFYSPDCPIVYEETFYQYHTSSMIVPPGLLPVFSDYQEKKNLNDSDFEQRICNGMQTRPFPCVFLLPQECAKVIIMEMHQDKKGLEECYHQAYLRLKQKYPTGYLTNHSSF